MICALVLAAGRSERMGCPKLLLPIAGQPVIARIIGALPECLVPRKLVVTQADSGPIRRALAGRDITFVENPDATGDMLSSIRCGLARLPPDCEAVLIVLGDQPQLNSLIVAELIRVFHSSGNGIVVPSHAGHRGHPVLIARRLCEALLCCDFPSGLRDFLAKHPDEIMCVETSDDAVLADMDTPADYQGLQNRYQA